MVTSDSRGYSLTVWHAHVGGLLSDCPEDRYTDLSYHEMTDLLEVLTDELMRSSLEERAF